MASQVSAAQAMGVQVSNTHHETLRVEPSKDSFSQIQRVKDNGDGTFLLSSIRTVSSHIFFLCEDVEVRYVNSLMTVLLHHKLIV